MDTIVLVEGEFRSLIRNTLEKIIGKNFKKDRSVNQKLLLQVSTRVVSSLIAIQVFNMVKSNIVLRKYTSYLLVGVFAMMILEEYKLITKEDFSDVDYCSNNITGEPLGTYNQDTCEHRYKKLGQLHTALIRGIHAKNTIHGCTY
tara:strand:- start:2885 stop:3319 length:435 start_codon:yes stop_codon:yes gene_type:complete